MAESADPTVQTLFKQWRSGDAVAGQAMAQKFTDWYYAVTTVRLGEIGGRAALQRACAGFAQGIATVTRAGDLVDWAHDVLRRELEAAGGRSGGADTANALTGNRPASALLLQVAPALTETQRRLLHATYTAETPTDALIAQAEAAGGWPQAVLDARLALKRALRDRAGVALQVVPLAPDLDRAPMPLYEAARMASAEEEGFFEKWLVSDLDLCRDVAEFSVFAHALRAGAMPVVVAAPAAPRLVVDPPRAAASPAERPAAVQPAPRPPASQVGLAIFGVVLALVAVVLVLVYFLPGAGA